MRMTLLPILFLSILVGCGGGGGGGGSSTPPPLMLNIDSDSVRDGTVIDDGAGTGDSIDAGAAIRVGDDASNNELRGFVSFPLAGIPANSNVVSAVLELRPFLVPTGLPFPDVRTDHIGIGAGLSIDDFGAVARDPDFGALVDSGTGVFTLDVTTQVQDDLDNARTYSEFRVRSPIPTDGDGVADMHLFGSGSTAPDLRPVLRLAYRIP